MKNAVPPSISGASISLIVLTYNEEKNLEHCLNSVKEWAHEIIIVDSFSTDATLDIARQYTNNVYQHPFENQAEQLNWALDNVPVSGDWVLRLDADEMATPELATEISSVLPGLSPDVTGLYIKRRVYFMGRWMRHGGYYPTWLLRAWRKGCARSEERVMDEHMVLLRGSADYLKHDIKEENRKDLFAWVERQNRYSSREVEALLRPAVQQEIAPSLFGTPVARRRWLKYNVYLRFPPFLRAFLFFLWRYFFQLGFLDGKEGLIFHFLQGCWHRFMLDAKLYEFRLKERRTGPPEVAPKAPQEVGERGKISE